ncbi:NADH-quinone oxidoreductase subunit C [Streptomyces sp. WMMC500]|uniref:NADH-quinone oxidoreductase subunit C n=1 Tax=Streptomyces sp. WMMC500 TaxID=3015154 RepID=UPI00248CB517|nr:NADH-quinone oxidoreductase subunit C [Streptomyces sp. WMMC500]WBB63839.1 NADH-quinone oxidoreductase subunit C [Streptomyces sp. WMMC500]
MTEQGEDPAGWLPRPAEDLFGPGAVANEAYDVLTVDVPADAWTAALRTARDELGCTFFDWLSAVDEPGEGFRVAAHVVAVGTPPRRLLLRTTVPHSAPSLATATGVYAGAAWHERETHEMFGVDFPGHPYPARLLLPEEFEGHPLRKDFVLAARVAKAWPGAKEPGESHAGGPKRRQMQPPGVPDPNDWGPMKGKLPPAPTRTPRRAATRPDGPPRRSRTTTEGSASQRPADTGPAEAAAPTDPPPTGDTPEAGPRRPRGGAENTSGDAAGAAPGEAGAGRSGRGARRARSASEGSASQRTAGGEPAGTPPSGDDPAPGAAPGEAGAGRPAPGARRSRSASGGSASQRAAGGGPAAAGEGARPRTRTPDAPWQRPRPDDESAPSDNAPVEGTPTAEPAAGAPAPPEPPASAESGPSPEPAANDTAAEEPGRAAGGPTQPEPPAGGDLSPAEPAAGERPPPPETASGEPGPSPQPAAGEPRPAPEPAAGEGTPPDEPAADAPAPTEPPARRDPAEGGDPS